MNQKGQVFIGMVFIMLIALFVGVTTSSRYIKSLRTIVQSDNLSKALEVAEAAVERILLIPSATLESYITNNNCGANCSLEITDTTGQKMIATVTLSLVGSSTSGHPVLVYEDESSFVTLTGYSSGKNIYVCWNGTTSITGLYTYVQSGAVKSTPFAHNAVLTSYSDNEFDVSSANFGYENCFTVVASQTPLALRLKSVYGRTDAVIVPQAGYTLPIQGIQITSKGVAGDAVKTITVVKSKQYTPAYFDYVLYQKSSTDALSN